MKALLHRLPNVLARLVPHAHRHPVLAVGRAFVGPCDYCGVDPVAPTMRGVRGG